MKSFLTIAFSIVPLMLGVCWASDSNSQAEMSADYSLLAQKIETAFSQRNTEAAAQAIEQHATKYDGITFYSIGSNGKKEYPHQDDIMRLISKIIRQLKECDRKAKEFEEVVGGRSRGSRVLRSDILAFQRECESQSDFFRQHFEGKKSPIIGILDKITKKFDLIVSTQNKLMWENQSKEFEASEQIKAKALLQRKAEEESEKIQQANDEKKDAANAKYKASAQYAIDQYCDAKNAQRYYLNLIAREKKIGGVSGAVNLTRLNDFGEKAVSCEETANSYMQLAKRRGASKAPSNCGKLREFYTVYNCLYIEKPSDQPEGADD